MTAKQYIKHNHFLMAIDLNDPEACEEMANIAFVMNLSTRTKKYVQALSDTIHNVEEGSLPLPDQKWEIKKP